MVNEKEGEKIKTVSQRIVEAQRHIRILDLIKWDEHVKHHFLAHKGQRLPQVDLEYYQKKKLPFDVNHKIEEFRIITRDTQKQLGKDSLITTLINQQCEEYIQAVQMLADRGTPAFAKRSMALYGSPQDAFYPGGPRLSQLGSLLFDILTTLDVQLQSKADIKHYTAQQAQAILQTKLSAFFKHHNDKVTVTVSDEMVADASAGADTIKLSQHVKFSERDLRYLEVHEGWVHVGTTLNGSSQPYCFFLSKGTPSCSVIQEGLAVITEVVSLASYPGRMRKITNRVIALDKVMQGADFIDIYRYFVDCGLNEENSYNHCVRIFRGSTPSGGPFTKDLSYAKGFILIYNFIRFAISQRRIDVIPLLFSGKITLDDLPVLTKLKETGVLKPPLYLPPVFEDLSALCSWLSFSLYLNQFDLNEIQNNFRQYLV